MKRLVIIGAAALALAACSDQTINTPSGFPEVTLQNVNADCVRQHMQSSAMSMGSLVRTSNDNMLIVGKPTKNMLAVALMGTGLNATPEERATIMYARLGNDLRIVAQLSMVSNPGTGLEHSVPTSNRQDAAALISLAERIGIACRLSNSR